MTSTRFVCVCVCLCVYSRVGAGASYVGRPICVCSVSAPSGALIQMTSSYLDRISYRIS